MREHIRLGRVAGINAGINWSVLAIFVQAQVSGALSDVRVRDVMSSDPTVAPSSVSVEQFFEDYVFPNRFSTSPLTEDGGRPAGLVTLNHVKAVPTDQRASTPIHEVTCPVDDGPRQDQRI